MTDELKQSHVILKQTCMARNFVQIVKNKYNKFSKSLAFLPVEPESSF
jgi:hypothetical protein